MRPPPPRLATLFHRRDKIANRPAERVGETVDVLPRRPLRYCHEDAVLMLGVVPRQRVSRRDAIGRHGVERPLHRRRDANRELTYHGSVREQLHPLDRRQPPSRVGGPPHQQLPELDESPLAKPGEVDDPAQRVQRLRGADVVGRLLAADVLLAGLQGEHEAAPAVDVGGLARDPARHPAQVLLGRGEEAERGAAVVEAAAERLALADRHVDAALAGRAEHRERDRVDGGDAEGAGLVGGGREGLEVLDRPEEVRVLHEDRGDVQVDVVLELGGVGDAIAQADLDHFAPKPRA